MHNSQRRLLRPSFQKKLIPLLEEYVSACRPPPDADPKRNPGRTASLAGFCRFLECGMKDMEALQKSAPCLFDRIRTVLEDELLSYSPSPTILSLYLKKRLGYGEDEEAGAQQAEAKELRLIFEHDILEDGK